MRCTIDASVFVASARSDEPDYLSSRKFLREAQSLEVYCPTLALLGVCCRHRQADWRSGSGRGDRLYHRRFSWHPSDLA